MTSLYTSGHMWFTPLPPTFQKTVKDASTQTDQKRDRAAHYRLSTIPEIDMSDANSSLYSYGDDAPTLYDQDIHHVNIGEPKEFNDTSSSIYSYQDTENGEEDDEDEDTQEDDDEPSVRNTTRYEDMLAPEPPQRNTSTISHRPTSSYTSHTSTSSQSSMPPKTSSKVEEAVLVRPATTLAIRVSSLSLREAKEVNHHARNRATRKSRLLNKLSLIFTPKNASDKGWDYAREEAVRTSSVLHKGPGSSEWNIVQESS